MHSRSAAGLESRVFTLQGLAGEGLRPVPIAGLDPFLRSLLVTDGTVTRALEAQTLDRVTVEVVDQARAALPAETASHLAMAPGQDSIRRRVLMRAKPLSSPVAYADSHLVPERLPPQFMATLSSSSEGIGGSLQQMHLESRRELLWFGIGAAPDWAPVAGSPEVLVRVYRLLCGGRPAMLIAESFVVELAAGAYRLAWGEPLSGAAASSAGRDAVEVSP